MSSICSASNFFSFAFSFGAALGPLALAPHSSAFSRLASDTVIPEYFAFQAETRALRHPVLAAEIGTLRPRLMLLQNANDLLFRQSCLLHRLAYPWAGL